MIPVNRDSSTINPVSPPLAGIVRYGRINGAADVQGQCQSQTLQRAAFIFCLATPLTCLARNTRRAVNEHDRRFHDAFEAFFAECVARGKVRDDVPVATLADVLASTFASLSLSVVYFEDFPIQERSTAAARFLAHSIQPGG